MLAVASPVQPEPDPLEMYFGFLSLPGLSGLPGLTIGGIDSTIPGVMVVKPLEAQLKVPWTAIFFAPATPPVATTPALTSANAETPRTIFRSIACP